MWGHNTLHIKITVFWDMTSLILVEKFQQNFVTSPKTVITKNKVLVCILASNRNSEFTNLLCSKLKASYWFSGYERSEFRPKL